MLAMRRAWLSANWQLWLAVVFLAILVIVAVLLQTGIIPAGDLPRTSQH